MSFNVATLPIPLGGMVEDFGVPPTVASSTSGVFALSFTLRSDKGDRAVYIDLLASAVATAVMGALPEYCRDEEIPDPKRRPAG